MLLKLKKGDKHKLE